jgi:hypothetical protein
MINDIELQKAVKLKLVANRLGLTVNEYQIALTKVLENLQLTDKEVEASSLTYKTNTTIAPEFLKSLREIYGESFQLPKQ